MAVMMGRHVRVPGSIPIVVDAVSEGHLQMVSMRDRWLRGNVLGNAAGGILRWSL